MKLLRIIVIIALCAVGIPAFAYTPVGDSRVIFWLDAADAATLFQDQAGTIPVNATGQLIGRWKDKSSNGWHAVANGGAAGMPVFHGNQQNGRPSVRFDGSSDSLSTHVASLQGSTYTFFVVARRISVRSQEALMSVHNAGAVDWNSDASVCVGMAYNDILGDARNYYIKSQLVHPGSDTSFMFCSKYDGGNNTAYLNGVGTTPVSSSGNLSAETITLGARNAALTEFNNHEYFEILIYNGALSDAERGAVEQYLGSKYALPNSQWAPPPPPPPQLPPGPYNPAADSHVVFWLDATDASTLFQDSAGNVPVTAAGQFIGRWKDKSANAWHVTANGGASGMPTLKAKQQNGFAGVRFDGSTDSMSSLLASLQGSKYTVFVVGKRASEKSLEAVLSIHNSGSNDWSSVASICLGMGYNGILGDVRDQYFRSQLAHPGSGVGFMYASKYDGTHNTVYLNGVAAAPVVSSGTLSAETITLGARGAGLADHNNYDYFEVLIFDFALSDEYRQAVESYLGVKYKFANTQWAPPPPPPPQLPTGPYTPAADPRVVFWLDSADPATLFQDTAGQTPVTAAGQFVGMWADKSQNGWHVTANGGAAGKPTFRTNRQNGRPAIRFDGTSDSMSTLLASLDGSQYTVFAVGRRMASRNLEGILSIHSANSVDYDSNESTCVGLGFNDLLGDARNNALTSNLSHPGSGVSFMYASKYNGTTNTVYLNGVAAAPVPSPGLFSAETITLGARGSNLTSFNCYEYFEVLIFDFALSDEYRHAVEAYLGAKYAFQDSQWAPPPPPPPQAPVGPYVPTGDPRLVFWLDSSDASTLFLDADATLAVTGGEQPVGAWKDKTESGWHMTVAGGEPQHRPTYKLNQMNGRPSIRTSGANWLRTRTASLHGSNYTFFIVCRRQSATFLEVILSIHDENSADWDNNKSITFGHVHDDGVLSDVRTDILLSSHMHPGNGVPLMFTSVYDGAFNTAYLNGVGAAPVASSGKFSSEVLTLGARNNFLYYYNDYDYFEVLIYDFAMDAAYRQAVENYLRAKYAIP
jgi:hypothetical protein